MGWVEWDDISVRGKHEAIVSEDVFNRVQAILEGRTTIAGFGTLDFPYKGLFKCGRCGCSFTGEVKKKRYRYMRCTGKRGPCAGVKVVREEDLTKQISEALRSISIPDAVFPALQEALKDVIEKEQKFQQENDGRLASQAQKLKDRLSNLYLDHVADRISSETYEDLRSKFEDELQSIRTVLSGMDRAESNLFDTGLQMLELARDAWKTFLEAKPMDRRDILMALGWNSTVIDGKVEVSMLEPFQSLYELAQKCGENGLESASDEEWYSGRDSNPRPPP
ncbi:MAG: recombinase zinc beta ribbon domain-containing protein [Fimbriimonadaceae bacterium]|nr:recombinase zinc beta ribbon domain-containing protein [Fimbriimonadaceae bacterium]